VDVARHGFSKKLVDVLVVFGLFSTILVGTFFSSSLARMYDAASTTSFPGVHGVIIGVVTAANESQVSFAHALVAVYLCNISFRYS
jgi:hypothetical protein